MRAVLVTIADAANRDGEYARPGIAAMVEGSLYGKSHVSRIVARLVAERWVEVMEQGNGRGLATVYRVLMETSPSVGGSETPPFGDPKPPHLAGETPPSEDLSPLFSTVENNGREQPRDPFEDFWKLYPRKTDKRSARKAWDRLVPKEALPATVIAGAQRFAADPNLPRDEPQFIPHPTTWLNGGRWGDEPLPPRAKPNGGPRAPYRPPIVMTDRTGPSRVLTEDDL